MSIKALAFDMDGTLLKANQEIHPETIDAIKTASEMGYTIIIATGRPQRHIVETADKLGCVDYMVANNGSLLYDVKKDEYLQVSSLPEEFFARLKELSNETKSVLAVHTNVESYRDKFYGEDGEIPAWVKRFNIELKTFLGEDKMMEAVKTEKILQISLVNDPKKIATIAKDLRVEVGDKYSIHIANEIYLDVNPGNISKLDGINKVLSKLDLSIDNVMAFGDSGNDLLMVKHAKIGVAMGNATDELKALADEIVDTNETNAIGKRIRELIKG